MLWSAFPRAALLASLTRGYEWSRLAGGFSLTMHNSSFIIKRCHVRRAGGPSGAEGNSLLCNFKNLTSKVLSRAQLAALQDVESDTRSFRRTFSLLHVLGFIDGLTQNRKHIIKHVE